MDRREILRTIGKIGLVGGAAAAAARTAQKIHEGNERETQRQLNERRGSAPDYPTATPYRIPKSPISRTVEQTSPGLAGSDDDKDKSFSSQKLMRSLSNPFPFAVYPHEQSGRKY